MNSAFYTSGNTKSCSIEFLDQILVFIAERLRARLLILQSMFWGGGVWPQLLSCLGMQLKVWLVCKHPSHLGMQLKDPVYKKCVHLHKSLSFPSSGASSFIVTALKWQKTVMSVRKSKLGD